MIGSTLGHFRITAKLGQGGMGEVYRAEDSKLGREVALKLLPREVAADAERLARFDREARMLAALDHPNIASIYSFDSATQGEPGETVHFLVMQLAEGETLAEIIARGRLSPDESLSIAQQLIEAFEFAHEKGIIHRDLKPGNVVVDSEGQVKVLDFGLAKALSPMAAEASSAATSDSPLSLSPTLTAEMTSPGVLLGTAAYMSPEQARGKPADKRSDIWTFGCVWFEMVTGQNTFSGETVSDVLAKILEREPPWHDLPQSVTRGQRKVLRRCLEKDPRQRYHDIADVRLALADSDEEFATQGLDSEPRPRSRKSRLIWLASALALGLLIGHLVTRESLQPAIEDRGPPIRLSVDLGEDNSLSFRTGSLGSQEVTALPFALSPDGRTLVVSLDLGSGSQLYLRPLDSAELQPIPGTDGGNSPFFSPDGRWIGFLTASGELKKTLVERGTPITLYDVRAIPQFLVGPGFAWTADNQIIFSLGGTTGLLKISADGGTPELLTRLDAERGEFAHVWPRLLPDGKSVVYTELFAPGQTETARIAAISLETGERTLLFEGATDAHPLPGGYLVFFRQGTLVAARFDLERLEIEGSPIAIAPHVRSVLAAPSIAVSRDGDLVFLAQGPKPGGHLVWVDRAGDSALAIRDRLTVAFSQLGLSPEGNRAVVTLADGIWLYDLGRGTRGRLPIDEGTAASFMVDGDRIVYRSLRPGGEELFISPISDTAEPVQLTQNPGIVATGPVASPDGKHIAYYRIHPETSRDIWVLNLEGEPEARPFQATTANERCPGFSPDGQWILYTSDESGREEVYARRLDGQGRKWQISTQGGVEPIWSKDGTEIFYRAWNKMIVVPVELGPELAVGKPQILWEGQYEMSGFQPAYDVDLDGERFLMVRNDEAVPVRHLEIILNWAGEVEAAVAQQ